jgi:hypothetical protein
MRHLALVSPLFFATLTDSFVVKPKLNSKFCLEATPKKTTVLPHLFEEDEDMIPVAENYIRAKYKQISASNGHDVADSNDLRSVLHQILPPVTPEELAREEQELLKLMLCKKEVCVDELEEDDFVNAIIKNSYWRAAGDIVVKELMYFDSLHAYYTTGKAILNDNDYDELHDNLTWEGSSVATMSRNEVKFVSAVAASKRGEPVMDDAEYTALKSSLKSEGSWVVNRQRDALEKNGLKTFIGYLHRALN